MQHAFRMTLHILLLMLLYSTSVQAVTQGATHPVTESIEPEAPKTAPLKLDEIEPQVSFDRKASSKRFKDVASTNSHLLQKHSISDFLPDGEADGNHLKPNFSPDGTKLSFIAQTTREVKMYLIDFETGLVSQLRVSSGEGRQSRQRGRRSRRRRTTTDEGAEAAELVWSNDGRYYAFTSEGKIYLGMPEVPKPYLLGDEGAYVAFPRWSPEDQQLLYASGKTGKGDLYRIANLGELLEKLRTDSRVARQINPTAIQREQLTGLVPGIEKDAEEDFATWRSENEVIYQSYRGGVSEFDLSELKLSNLRNPTLRASLNLDQMYPRLSPDGRKLGFYMNNYWKKPDEPESFSFHINLSFHNDLNNRNLSDSLKQAFSNQRIQLPDRSQILVEEKDRSWQIRALPTIYNIKKDGIRLSVSFLRLDPNQQRDKFALAVTQGAQGIADTHDQFTYDAVIIDPYKGPLWSPNSDYLLYIADQSAQNYPIIAHPLDSVTGKPLTESATEINCTAVDLAGQTGKLIGFVAKDTGSAFQKLSVGVVNFSTKE
jgi:hypothetical protein